MRYNLFFKCLDKNRKTLISKLNTIANQSTEIQSSPKVSSDFDKRWYSKIEISLKTITFKASLPLPDFCSTI